MTDLGDHMSFNTSNIPEGAVFYADQRHGSFGESSGVVCRLTDCCGALGKDVVDDHGWFITVCRLCYGEVSEKFTLGAVRGSDHYLRDLARMLEPCSSITPGHCPMEVDAGLIEAAWLYHEMKEEG